jgi:hypothetical protein
MSVRFLGSFSISPEIMRNHPTMQQGVEHYQRYAAILDDKAPEIHQLAPEAHVGIYLRQCDGANWQKGKVDLVSVTIPLPVYQNTPSQESTTPQNAEVKYSWYFNNQSTEDWFHKLEAQLVAFIAKAQFLMPQGAHTKKLPAKVQLSTNFLESLAWHIGDAPLDSSDCIQLIRVLDAFRRFEGVFERLPASIKFEVNTKTMKELESWGVMKASYPDLRPEWLNHSNPDPDYMTEVFDAREKLKMVVPSFESFQNIKPDAFTKRVEIDMDWSTVEMSITDRFNKTSIIPVGMMPIRFRYHYDKDPKSLKAYAEGFDYDGFVQECLKRTHQWIQILKPEGYDAIYQKEV